MNILAFDSSTPTLSVALVTAEGSATFSIDIGTKHTERLMDAIDICVSRSGIAKSELDLVACALGPGSFTGLRIGMATAKGLALALGLPWVAVPVLDCHAFGLECFTGLVVPVLDGKKGRLYAAIYRRGLRSGDWLDIAQGELLGKLDAYAEVLFCGPDAALFEGSCLERPGFGIFKRPEAGTSLAMAALAGKILEKEGPSRDDSAPLYLRSPEAEESVLR
jgi:tRNA threonylcarbamoyladenosine biosynthesis protein TsaB